MPDPNGLEILAGFLLIFFVPGFTVTRATFPEWRVRGAGGRRRLVETVTLSFVLSVGLTVLVGYAILAGGPTGFQASWSDPVLEAILAGIAAVAFVVGIARGAYRREPPPGPSAAPEAEVDPLELTRELDRLAREERRIRHQLRVGTPPPAEQEQLNARLAAIVSERSELETRQEASFAR
jgi:uncharacterized membrane protein